MSTKTGVINWKNQWRSSRTRRKKQPKKRPSNSKGYGTSVNRQTEDLEKGNRENYNPNMAKDQRPGRMEVAGGSSSRHGFR